MQDVKFEDRKPWKQRLNGLENQGHGSVANKNIELRKYVFPRDHRELILWCTEFSIW
jgi:hypothetical protein